MAYEFEDVRTGQEIFYYLLEHHELREAEAPQLYKRYTESEAVQNLVKSQGLLRSPPYPVLLRYGLQAKIYKLHMNSAVHGYIGTGFQAEKR